MDLDTFGQKNNLNIEAKTYFINCDLEVDNLELCMPLILTLGRQRQVDHCEFEAILVYVEFQDNQNL